MTAVKRWIAAGLMLCLPGAALAQMDGHGPDAWQVAGVAADDSLNVRTGPGTDHPVIGTFAHDATGLQMVTCVPYLTRQTRHQLSERQRADLPPRWCLMKGRDNRTSGWVSAHYIREDTSGAAQASDTMVADAVALVQRLYDMQQNAGRGGAPGPLELSQARQFFFADFVEHLRRGEIGANPLVDAQDSDITDLRVFPAPERAMFRGRVIVFATFRNFGQPHRAIFHLRVDPALPNPALRIMRIEHESL